MPDRSESDAPILTRTPTIRERAITDIHQLDEAKRSIEQLDNQPIDRSINQPNGISDVHPIAQTTEQPAHQSYSTTHPRRSSVSVSINPPLVHSDDKSNQSIHQTHNLAFSQPKPSPSKLKNSLSSYCLSPSNNLSINTNQTHNQSTNQPSNQSLNEPLSAPPEPGPPPAPLLESMAAVSSRRANAGMTENKFGVRPSQSVDPSSPLPQSVDSPNTVYNSGSGGFLTELLGKTQSKKSHLDKLTDEGRKRAAAERLARLHRRKNNLSIEPPALPTFECPRCHQVIYEFDRESHSTSHSSEILPFLFLGGERNASNKTELTLRTNITHILNVAWEVANFFPDQFVYENYALSDYSDSALIDVLDSACCFIERCRLSGGSCLVHCVQGISRSASVVAAYLIATRGMTAQDAIEFVREKRSLIDPNPGFRQQLEQYARLWRQRRRDGYTLEQLLVDHQRPIHSIVNDRSMNQEMLENANAVKDSNEPRLEGHAIIQHDMTMSSSSQNRDQMDIEDNTS